MVNVGGSARCVPAVSNYAAESPLVRVHIFSNRAFSVENVILGLAMIVITHDFGVVSRICHRVAVMYAGRIVETADVRTVFSAPAHPYTVALLKSLPRFGAALDRLHTIGGQPPDLRDLPQGCSFAPRCPQAMDICTKESPPRRQIASGHWVCCHLADTGRPLV